MLTINEYKMAFELATVAYVFSCVLQQDKYILSWYGTLINYINANFKYGYILAYPLGYCEKCFAGQLALWYYIYKHYNNYTKACIIEHIIFISMTILFTLLIKQFIKKWMN